VIRAGFIGVGGISAVHLNYLKERKDVKIAALSDISAENVKDKLSKYGGKGYSDFKEMLKKEKLDAVWVCTPSVVREEPLVACAEAGIPVFCEKPAERSVAKAAKIADKLDKLKAKVQIGYVFRCTQPVVALKKKLKADKVHLAQSFYGCNVSITMGLRDWFYKKEISGGALVDQATHNLDLLRFLFGEVTEVSGFANNPVHAKKPGYTIDEVLSLCFLFESGLLASHIHTWVGDGWRNEIVLSGEKALYRLNGGSRLVVECQSQDPLKAKKEKRADDNIVTHEGSIYTGENEAFLKMVKSGKWAENPSSYRDALNTLQLTVACDQAVTKCGAVRIKKI
jgi:predicted dehydrogenase